MPDDIMRRIAHIVDHEEFDGEGTLGQQVAERIAPALNDVWRAGYETCHDLYVNGTPPTVALADVRRRAVFEVMDLEGELEAQEKS